MLQKVQKSLRERNMVSPQEKLLVGVSGGADSVCLLLVLHALKDEMDFSLEAVHVEHGIRGAESVADADFVKALCEKLQVPCSMVSVDVPTYAKDSGMGTEEAARVLRYQAFARLAKEKSAKVAVAHHMEDNAETILFQMARGSALTGLCGMQPVRTDDQGVTYIRPLLEVRRSEIEAFLKEKGQAYCIDGTNAQLEYSRNLLRQTVLPQLEKVNTQAISHINETATALSEVKDFLEVETARSWQAVVTEGTQELSIDCKRLQELHMVLQKEILYQGLATVLGGKKDITSTHVESLLSLCNGQSGKEVSFPNEVVAKKDFDKVYLFTKSEKIEDTWTFIQEVSKERLNEAFDSGKILEIPLGDARETLKIRVFEKESKTGEIPKKSYTKWLDYDKIKTGFCIRNRLSGDYFICDQEGHSKKLKQYFIDEKIPSSKRERMWLLAQEHLVLWLIGGRISEHLKVTEETEIIVELEYKGGN